jgi:hypothetical protein
LGTSILDVGGSGVNFTSSGGNLDTINTTSLLGFPGSRIDLTLAANVLALSFHYTLSSGATTVCVDYSGPGVCDQDPFVSAPAIFFFGVVSDAPIAGTISLRTLTGSLRPVITDFQVGVAGVAEETPEPNTLFLIGTGLVMVSGFRRLRRRS